MECANILWKKVQRSELNHEEAKLAAKLLEQSDIELFGMRGLLAILQRFDMFATDCFNSFLRAFGAFYELCQCFGYADWYVAPIHA